MADEEEVAGAADQTGEDEADTGSEDGNDTGDQDTGSDTGSDDGDKGEDGGDEDLEQVRKDAKAFKDQKRRAEKAEADAKALRDKYEPRKETDRAPKKNDQVAALEERTSRAEERAIRAELAAAGHKHPDDVTYILDAAKRLGVEPLEAASDELVAGKLKRMGEARATKEATPAPSGRSGSGKSGTDVGKLADKVAAGGELPKDPATAEKVQKELARRSQAGA